MSRRAIVAVQSEGDAFDLHYSQNGAESLQLATRLHQYIEDGVNPQDVVRRANDTPILQELERMQAAGMGTQGPVELGSRIADQLEMRPDPFVTDVALADVGRHVAFNLIEALYVVHDGGVDTYLPVWSNVTFLEFLRDHATVLLYETGGRTRHPGEVLEHNEPTDELTGDDFAIDALRTDEARWDLFAGAHQSIVQVLGLDREDTPDIVDKNQMGGFLIREDYLIVAFCDDTDAVPTPQATRGEGVFLHVPWTPTDDRDELERQYHENYYEPRRWLSERRLEHAGDREAADADDETNYEKAFVMDCLREYDGRVAPWSPWGSGVLDGVAEKRGWETDPVVAALSD